MCVPTDVVYLGVLHTEHWKVGLLFLEAGKNVLCEKPFAMNSKQVKELIAAAKKNNVFLMEVKMGKPHLLFQNLFKRMFKPAISVCLQGPHLDVI